MRVRRAALCVASAIGLLAAAAQADLRRPASDSEPVVDARVERVVPGPGPSLDVYFDRVTFAEQEGEPPTSTPLKYIAAADLDPDRSVIREIEVKEWKTSSDDVVLLVNDSHRCTLHLTRDSYTASCR